MTKPIVTVITSLIISVSTFSAKAQHAAKIPRIGYFAYYSEEGHKLLGAFRQGLRDLGYVDGKNIAIEVRRAEGNRHRIPALIAELLRLNPDIIVAGGRGAEAAKEVTDAIPIVVTYSANPVQQGLVASFARPGENITGLSDFHGDLVSKRVQLLKEVAPSASSVAVLFHPGRSSSRRMLKDVEVVAPALGLKVLPLAIKAADDFEPALATIRKEHPGGLIQSVALGSHQTRIIELAAKSRLPAIYTRGQWVVAGGLMSYGSSWPDLFRRAAIYVDKILKGAKPDELPVEQPTKFELIVNLKTAKAVGIKIPRSILLRADELIE